MTRLNRTQLLLIALASCLLAVDLWSAWVFLDAKDSADNSARSALLCKDMAGQIQALRRRPTVAATADVAESELSRNLEQAAAAAGMGVQSLVQIAPQTVSRIGDSDYVERPVDVVLGGVTLRQLIPFLLTATDENSGLELKDLRLTAPRQDDSGATWNAELTLRYLIFQPRGTGPQRD
jgi:hypothetical protein